MDILVLDSAMGVLVLDIAMPEIQMHSLKKVNVHKNLGARGFLPTDLADLMHRLRI